MSPVEQIALTVNIALRRDASTLDYYRAGSSPDAFATLPKEWTADQIRSFQDYFDALMSGNLARRRQTKFMPADFKLIEARQPPLKDQYDEWLARIICYAFSVPVSPFVSQVNRATSETLRQQATQEGLVPLKAWVKNALDHVIQDCMNEPGLEFVWVGDDAIDPLEQAQTLQILVGAGIKTREEARADLGLGPTRAGRGRRLPSQILVRPQMRHPVQTQSQAFPRCRTKREHFLDRLRRLPSRADIHDLELRLGERIGFAGGTIRPRFRPASFLMMPLVAAGRHLSSKASDWPPMPRRSSNRGQSFGADLPDNNRPMDNLLGFFSFHIRACPTANPSV